MLSEEQLKQIEAYLGPNNYAARPGSYVRPMLATIRELQARVAELEHRLNPPCGDPSIDAFYLDTDKALDGNADFDVLYIHGKPTGEVTYSTVTNETSQPAQVTFYPQEAVYTPGELSQYPSKTVGEP